MEPGVYKGGGMKERGGRREGRALRQRSILRTEVWHLCIL